MKLVLEGVDKYGNLFGTVLYTPLPAAAPANGAAAPAPAAAAAAGSGEQEHLAEQLLKHGLAKVSAYVCVYGGGCKDVW